MKSGPGALTAVSRIVESALPSTFQGCVSPDSAKIAGLDLHECAVGKIKNKWAGSYYYNSGCHIWMFYHEEPWGGIKPLTTKRNLLQCAWDIKEILELARNHQSGASAGEQEDLAKQLERLTRLTVILGEQRPYALDQANQNTTVELEYKNNLPLLDEGLDSCMRTVKGWKYQHAMAGVGGTEGMRETVPFCGSS